MPYLLTFELEPDGEVLHIHGDADGLRLLARRLEQLAVAAERGQEEHDHLFTPEWGGNELTSKALSASARLLQQATVHAWPAHNERNDA